MNGFRRAAALLGMVLLLAPALSVQAEGTYRPYTYDYWEQAVPVAAAYLPAAVQYGSDMGVDGLGEPQDLYVSDQQEVYILDSGNSRVVVLHEDLTLARVIAPTTAAGQPLTFEEAAGIFVCTDGRILVADKKGQTVYILDAAGRQLGALGRPDEAVLPDNFQYQPVRVFEDSGGILYVVCAGSYSGAVQFETDGSFLGFYGSEKVTATAEVLANYVWKNLLSDKQAEGLSRTVPVEIVSACIDQKDFIYTIRKGNDVTNGQVRKLNAQGDNTLKDGVFGDRGEEQQLADIAVDDGGFISVLDSGSGRVFQYDPDGTLLYVFGGKGAQEGCYASPVALETLGDRLLVLDAERGSLTALAPTAFAADIREGTRLYRDGKYQQAMAPWQRVLARDYHYEPANLGMGKAYEGLGDYETAMACYKRANNRDFYSDVFSDYRTAFLRQYLGWFLLLLVAAVAVPVIVVNRRSKAPRPVYAGGRPKRKYPVYCLFHPVEGYADLKSEKSGSFWLANLLLLAYFIVSILIRQTTGFIFNQNRTDQFNVFVTLSASVGLFLIFVLCNWAITTIMDGKGKFLEIWTFCAYALLPYVVLMVIVVIASNVLSGDEAAFYTALQGIAYAWTGLSLFLAIREVHQFSVQKTIATLLLTFAAMLIVVIIVAILYSVFSQFIGFIATLGSELALRS